MHKDSKSYHIVSLMLNIVHYQFLVLNFHGAVFMYSEDFYGVERTGVAISKFLLGATDSIGPSNALQVVTNNTTNCKAAGWEIENVFIYIFWLPFCVHTLNMMFKDLAIKFY